MTVLTLRRLPLGPIRTLRSWNIWDIFACLLILLFSVAYIWLGILEHIRLETGLDLAIYGQALYQLSHGHLPFSSLKDQVLWGDHAHFILVFLAPFYRLFPDVRMLIVVQALSVTTAGWALYRLATRTTRHAFLAIALLFAYLSFIGLQYALDNDFHSVVLTGAALAWMLYALSSGSLWLTWLSLILGLLTREDAGPIFFMIGAWLLLLRKRVRLGLAIMTVSAAYFFLVGYVVMPHWTKGHFPLVYLDVEDKNPAHIVRGILLHPYTTLQNMFDTPLKVRTFKRLLASFGYLPLLSPLFYLTSVPILYSRFLSPNDYRWTIVNHTNANIAPLLAASAVFGSALLLRIAGRLGGQRIRMVAAATLSVLLLAGSYRAAWSDPDAPLRKLLRREFVSPAYFPKNQIIAFRRAREFIPPHASIAASHGFMPYLSNRRSIVLFPNVREDTEWIIVSRKNTWPLRTGEMEEVIAELEKNPQWLRVFKGESTWVFKRR